MLRFPWHEAHGLACKAPVVLPRIGSDELSGNAVERLGQTGRYRNSWAIFYAVAIERLW